MGEVKHLKDIFGAGRTVVIKVIDPETHKTVEIPLWISKISSRDHEKIMDACRVAQTRRKKYIEAELSETLDDQIPDDLNEIVDTLLLFQREEIRRASYEEVLYNKDVGSDWSEEGFDLIGLSAAISKRSEEIAEHNASNPKDKILLEEDEELVRLTQAQEKFFDEVAEVSDEKREVERAKLKTFSKEELRDKLRAQILSLEVQSAWYDEFKRQVVLHCAYYDDSRRTKYFSDMDEIDRLPDYIFDQIWDAYDENSFTVDEIKK